MFKESFSRWWDKRRLYEEIEKFRRRYQLDSFPVDTFRLAKQIDPKFHVEIIPFPPSSKLNAFLYKGEQNSTISLRFSHSVEQRNYYCGHELIHYLLKHEANTYCHLNHHSATEEWQANEGAAELLVPYADFIPYVVDSLDYAKRPHKTGATSITKLLIDTAMHSYKVHNALADRYGVTVSIISVRLKSLAFEIQQYQRGVDIGNIEILSLRKQNERNSLPLKELRKQYFADDNFSLIEY